MTDYTERGAVPIDDAAVDRPPTVDEVLELQRRDFPEQAATSTLQPGASPAGRQGEAPPEKPAPEKPVDQSTTGDEQMTGPQQSYLQTLASDTGIDVPADLTKAQASDLIEQRSLIDEVAERGVVDQHNPVTDDGAERFGRTGEASERSPDT